MRMKGNDGCFVVECEVTNTEELLKKRAMFNDTLDINEDVINEVL